MPRGRAADKRTVVTDRFWLTYGMLSNVPISAIRAFESRCSHGSFRDVANEPYAYDEAFNYPQMLDSMAIALIEKS